MEQRLKEQGKEGVQNCRFKQTKKQIIEVHHLEEKESKERSGRFIEVLRQKLRKLKEECCYLFSFSCFHYWVDMLEIKFVNSITHPAKLIAVMNRTKLARKNSASCLRSRPLPLRMTSSTATPRGQKMPETKAFLGKSSPTTIR